jgi:hypothetical protein
MFQLRLKLWFPIWCSTVYVDIYTTIYKWNTFDDTKVIAAVTKMQNISLAANHRYQAANSVDLQSNCS